MTFVDANVFMYAAGAPHPHKAPSAALLRAVALGEIEAVTSLGRPPGARAPERPGS